MESRESETLGKWMTEESLKKSGKYSASQVKNILSYCRKFPESLVRQARHWDGACKQYTCHAFTKAPKNTMHILIALDFRPWQYNDSVNEYYVILDDQRMLKKAEVTREQEETELAES